ncbi:MAG: PqqD family protein, partial [Pseudomonadota bacterium]
MDEETIVVDPRTREVHLFNETAARIWELLASPCSLEQLSAALA